MINYVIGLAAVLIVFLTVSNFVKKSKSGKGGCGCGCDSCSSASHCHSNK